MTSRLSSLLVRDGVVAVRRMEKAFQRQVLFGGGLDTILLEMNELNEQRLLQFLSLATGLPPATARELDGADPRAAARCSRDLAERFAVVPLWFDGDALRVLTRDPVDLGVLEDLASELGAAIQPFVAPEFRYELAFDRVFGRRSEERFTRLADASRLSAIPPVGRSPSVVVEAGGVTQQNAGSRSRPMAVPTAAAIAAAEAELDGAGAGAAIAAAAPSASAVAEAAGMAETAPIDGTGAPLFGRRTIEMTSEAVRHRREEVDRQAATAYRRHTTSPQESQAEPAVLRAEAAPEPAPEPAGANEATGPAAIEADMDAAPTAESFAAETAPYRTDPADPADPAEGAPESLDADAAPVVVIEYETSEASELAVTSPLPRPIDDRPGGIVSGEIGPAEASGPPVIDAPAAPTGPLVVGDSAATVQPFRRVSGFDPSPLSVADARELLVQAEHRDRVFELLLRAVRARTWYVALLTVQGGAAIGRVAIAGDEVDHTSITQVLIPLDAPSAFRQTVNTSSPYIGPVATGDADIDGMIRRMGGVVPPSALLIPLILRNRVVALVIGHRGGDMLRVTELSELLPLAAAATDALGRIIRRGKKSRQMTAVAPGISVPDAVDDNAPTTRMAAVTVDEADEPDAPSAPDPIDAPGVASAGAPAPAGPPLSPLVQQLFDPDQRIRDLAIERLSTSSRAQLGEALEAVRRALDDRDAARVESAAEALAAFGDVRAIPPLLDAHARGGEAARVAGRALVSLTKQDFGDSNRKWRQWWDKNRRKNRIEWLLEGLGHKETEIRRSAVDDLRKATGEFFGYHPDLPRREREQARQRWMVWWQETGRLRFLPDAEPDRAQAPGATPPQRS